MRGSLPALVQLAASHLNLGRTICALRELGAVVELAEPGFHHLSNGNAALTGQFLRIPLDWHQ